jgi:hypothetical protein
MVVVVAGNLAPRRGVPRRLSMKEWRRLARTERGYDGQECILLARTGEDDCWGALARLGKKRRGCLQKKLRCGKVKV